MVKPKHYGREMMSDTEVLATLNKANGLRDKALFLIYYLYGIRVSEGIGIRVGSDIYVEDKKLVLRVRREKQRKSAVASKEIMKLDIENTPYIRNIIRYMNTRPFGEYLFPGRTDGHLGRSRVLKIFQRMNNKIWCHFLRANRVTYFKKKGYPDQMIVDWFGWVDSRPLKKYAGRQPVELRID